MPASRHRRFASIGQDFCVMAVRWLHWRANTKTSGAISFSNARRSEYRFSPLRLRIVEHVAELVDGDVGQVEAAVV
jgi:hypothetical protein